MEIEREKERNRLVKFSFEQLTAEIVAKCLCMIDLSNILYFIFIFNVSTQWGKHVSAHIN